MSSQGVVCLCTQVEGRKTRKNNVRGYTFEFSHRCEAVNSANLGSPASTRVRFSVFFPPSSLTLEVERPEAEARSSWDRTETFKKT